MVRGGTIRSWNSGLSPGQSVSGSPFLVPRFCAGDRPDKLKFIYGGLPLKVSSNTPLECPSCGKKAVLVGLTAEDIQRSRPPSISMTCAECREKYRSVARLETRYSTNMALRDLALMVIVAFSLLILFSNVVSGLRVYVPVGVSQIIFFVTAATSLTGLKMAYGELGRRYAFTHSLAWSLHSRYAMMSISLIISGILAAVFPIFFV